MFRPKSPRTAKPGRLQRIFSWPRLPASSCRTPSAVDLAASRRQQAVGLRRSQITRGRTAASCVSTPSRPGRSGIRRNLRQRHIEHRRPQRQHPRRDLRRPDADAHGQLRLARHAVVGRERVIGVQPRGLRRARAAPSAARAHPAACALIADSGQHARPGPSAVLHRRAAIRRSAGLGQAALQILAASARGRPPASGSGPTVLQTLPRSSCTASCAGRPACTHRVKMHRHPLGLAVFIGRPGRREAAPRSSPSCRVPNISGPVLPEVIALGKALAGEARAPAPPGPPAVTRLPSSAARYAFVTTATYSGRFMRPSILMDATPMRSSSRR